MTENNYDGWDGSERRTEHWHIAKEVPIAVLFMLVVQTAGGIWWLAQLSAKIDGAISRLAEFQVERYTREDARRDREFLFAVIDQVRQRNNDQDRRLSIIEDMHSKGGK